MFKLRRADDFIPYFLQSLSNILNQARGVKVDPTEFGETIARRSQSRRRGVLCIAGHQDPC